MDDSSLNQAHYQKRKAERLTRQGVFKGAIECHGKAADLIANVLHCCEGPTVRQSLVCQREHHFRQIWLLQSKITLLRQYRQQRMNSTKGNSCSVTDSEYDRKIKDLQSDIMRTLFEANSALHLYANTCTVIDPKLKQVMECHERLEQQLEDLFNCCSSDKETRGTLERNIDSSSTDHYSQPSVSPSPEEEKGPNMSELELPPLAPLEVPRFDFAMDPATKFDDD